MFHNFLNNVLLIEKINSSVFLKVFWAKSVVVCKKILFLAMVCPLRGGGIPLFLKKISISFGKILSVIAPQTEIFCDWDY